MPGRRRPYGGRISRRPFTFAISTPASSIARVVSRSSRRIVSSVWSGMVTCVYVWLPIAWPASATSLSRVGCSRA